MTQPQSWTPQQTRDGSFTFFSEAFQEAFHSQQGARAEAFEKFAQATELQQQAQMGSVRLLDVCYGLGYNTAAAIEVVWAANPHCQIEVCGLELDETVPKAAIEPLLLSAWSPTVQTILKAIAIEHRFADDRLSAALLIGDARQTIQQLRQQGFRADAVFFDPFSPRRCPQLWTVEFFQQVGHCLAPTGKLATYSRSAAVRSAMQQAGLTIGTIPLSALHLPHEWSQGTVAAWTQRQLYPLSLMEQEHLHTRAAVPYRDPHLSDTAEIILQRHLQAQAQSTLESTSSWRRRWNVR